jgi:hypothetical protein
MVALSTHKSSQVIAAVQQHVTGQLARYGDMLARIANGQVVSPSEVLEIATAVGKPLDGIDADVAVYLRWSRLRREAQDSHVIRERERCDAAFAECKATEERWEAAQREYEEARKAREVAAGRSSLASQALSNAERRVHSAKQQLAAPEFAMFANVAFDESDEK